MSFIGALATRSHRVLQALWVIPPVGHVSIVNDPILLCSRCIDGCYMRMIRDDNAVTMCGK